MAENGSNIMKILLYNTVGTPEIYACGNMNLKEAQPKKPTNL